MMNIILFMGAAFGFVVAAAGFMGLGGENEILSSFFLTGGFAFMALMVLVDKMITPKEKN